MYVGHVWPWHVTCCHAQVTLAVLVSGWAHVLHAVYKPWGAGSAMYSLQHGSLFVTSFVFQMGLLFKVPYKHTILLLELPDAFQ